MATATPSPSGVVRELVPRVARVVRPTARTGFWGKGRGFLALPPCLLMGFQGSSGIKRGRKGDWQEQRLNDQSTNRDPRETAAASEPHSNSISNIRPFYSPGLRPSLRLAPRHVPCSTPLRGVSRRVPKGGVPPPWPRHTAYPPIGRGCATPPPSHSVRRRSGGRFRRE